MENTWHKQYLDLENMWYIIEMHHLDGILGEHFFMDDEVDKMEGFIKENEIEFKDDN
jgi:hypothetical protein